MTDTPDDPRLSGSPDTPDYSQQLRNKAESMNKTGKAPASHGYTLGTDALAVLYKLASSPDSAADSLKMLHELQTHQIELDLQQEQNEANERETAAELAHYKTLYEFAPVGYFIISQDGRILESNRAGAALLGLACNDIDGCALENFLAHASRPVFNWQLKKLFNGSPGETCTLHTIDTIDPIATRKSKARILRVFANLSPKGEGVLMICHGNDS